MQYDREGRKRSWVKDELHRGKVPVPMSWSDLDMLEREKLELFEQI